MVTWISDHRCRVGDAELIVADFVDRSVAGLWLEKSRPAVEAYAKILGELDIDHVVELGIKRGGSTVMINEIACPTKLVAIDIEPATPPALARYVTSLRDPSVVALHHGVDQADRDRLRQIVDLEFGGAAIDLIVDDASHRFDETVASFEALFPLLRPGGWYLLEDWNWQHLVARQAAADPASDHLGADQRPSLDRLLASVEESNHVPQVGGRATAMRPLTSFVQQLVIVRAQSDDVVQEIVIGSWWIRVRRGTAVLDRSFRLTDCYTDHFEEMR